MISFDHLNLVVKKIQKKGLSWLYTRVKRKIVSPTFDLLIYLPWQIVSFRKLYQQNNVAPRNKIVPEARLPTVYDLNFVPATFNFAEKYQFLSWKQDMFENIRGEFLEFLGSAFPLKKSGNVEKGVTCYE
ncbi:hypothetical protein N8Z86_03030 [Amylibacter sp.]|nr:hypothetical protein [Amylibacter sp.]MDC1243082.1 hypothetical protein [Amylibacter sp.]